ncbi:MAG TPA: XdhC family protein [Steroidobacteraceae bacterium]|nr:XdhC family protein [Steroidobacteraceae bacterium]
MRLDTSLELLLERGVRSAAALATVVATAGSTYRKPGARMLILADGGHVGLLSGGCLEADLALHAREVIDGASARAVEYDMRGPDDILFGIGAGCEGAMRVLLEPTHAATAAAALESAGRITGSGYATCLVCVHESGEIPLGTYGPASLPAVLTDAAERALAQQASHELSIASGSQRLRAFVQFLPPPPHLLICGAGPDAQPVCAAARALGWRVSIVDHRPAYAQGHRFPGARVVLAGPAALADGVDLDRCHAAVVMSHHLDSDIEYLRVLARAGCPDYVGLLGPAARRRRIGAQLGSLGEPLRSRLRGPVGSDIGALTPEAIAVAIVSEVHAWLAGRLGGIHATAASGSRVEQEA